MAETLTRFVLETIFLNWPDPLIPDDLARIDKDDSIFLPTGERTQSRPREEYTLISVSRDATDATVEGTGATYETMEVLDVEIEGLVAEQFGTLDSHAEFRRIVEKTKTALDTERSYPDPNLTNRTRQSTRLSMFIGSETDRSHADRDSFHVGFPLRIRGKLDPDT